MAEKIWLGGQGTVGFWEDFELAANWSPAVVPADGDNLVFDDRAGLNASGKRYSCLKNLDQSAKNFTEILIDASYDGDIGIGYETPTADESALECSCDSIIFRGSGNAWLTAHHATTLFDEIICDSYSGALYIGNAETNGQHTVLLINIQGNVQFLEAITDYLAAPDLRALKQILSGAVTVVTGGGYDDIDIEMINGQLYLDSGFNSLLMVAGTMHWGNDGFMPAASKDGTGAVLYGGILNWKMLSKLEALKLWGGVVTASGAQDKTLGNSAINGGTIEVWGGKLDLQTEQAGSMTLNTDCEVKLMTRAASFLPPKNVNVTW